MTEQRRSPPPPRVAAPSRGRTAVTTRIAARGSATAGGRTHPHDGQLQLHHNGGPRLSDSKPPAPGRAQPSHAPRHRTAAEQLFGRTHPALFGRPLLAKPLADATATATAAPAEIRLFHAARGVTAAAGKANGASRSVLRPAASRAVAPKRSQTRHQSYPLAAHGVHRAPFPNSTTSTVCMSIIRSSITLACFT